MASEISFTFARYQDGVLSIDMQPPTSVSGWTTELYLTRRKGGTDKIFSKFCASGFAAGQSGITLANGQIGIFNVAINSVDTSGLDFGNYHATFERLDSGYRTILAEGYGTIK